MQRFHFYLFLTLFSYTIVSVLFQYILPLILINVIYCKIYNFMKVSSRWKISKNCFSHVRLSLGQKNVKSSSDAEAEENGYYPPNNVFVFLCEVSCTY